MTTDTLIEQRLTAAEKAISELQQQLAKPAQALSGLARVDTMRESSGNWTAYGIRGSASDRPG